MRAAILASFIGFAVPAQACEAALMLAVDVSGSVDPNEYRVQMDGLAAGLLDGSVTDALISGRVKLALMQWTGAGRQSVVIGWTEMTKKVDVTTFADRVVSEPRLWRNFSTAIGEALVLSLTYFAQVPECKRHVIDVSGDGRSNEGRSPRNVWQDLSMAEVTVNAIVIEQSVPNLAAYFESEVNMGPGAFVVLADRFEDYPEQIVRKLYRELTKTIASTQMD